MTPLRQVAAMLGAAAGGRIDPPPPLDGPDWQAILEVAAPMDLLPALWASARDLRLLEPVPAALVEVLGDARAPRNHIAATLELAHRRNAERTAGLLAQLDDAVAVLGDAGIPVVALKGIGHVIRKTWTDPADRVMADIDLLVPVDEAAHGHSLLQQAGYTATELALKFRDHHHHLPYLSDPARPGAIELHIEPVARSWTAALSAADVWAAAVPVAGRAPEVFVPSPAHAAVLGLVHAYLADGAWSERTLPVRTVHELWLLDRHEPVPWSQARAQLARVHRSILVDEHLVAVHTLLGGAPPPTAWGSIRSRVRLQMNDARGRRPGLTRLAAPVDRLTAAFDTDRLRRQYGDADPWRLRLQHVRRQLRRH